MLLFNLKIFILLIKSETTKRYQVYTLVNSNNNSSKSYKTVDQSYLTKYDNHNNKIVCKFGLTL